MEIAFEITWTAAVIILMYGIIGCFFVAAINFNIFSGGRPSALENFLVFLAWPPLLVIAFCVVVIEMAVGFFKKKFNKGEGK